MFRKTVIVAAVSLLSASAYAATDNFVKESIKLQDGAIVHVFNDGKMGMENRYGRAFQMPAGHAMATVDGRTITMKGNEATRVTAKLQARHAP